LVLCGAYAFADSHTGQSFIIFWGTVESNAVGGLLDGAAGEFTINWHLDQGRHPLRLFSSICPLQEPITDDAGLAELMQPISGSIGLLDTWAMNDLRSKGDISTCISSDHDILLKWWYSELAAQVRVNIDVIEFLNRKLFELNINVQRVTVDDQS
jgi:hypothetical protein